MPHFTKEDLGVIKTCYEKNGWQGKRLVTEFPEKGWSARSVNKAIKRLTTKGTIFGKKSRSRLGTESKEEKKASAKTEEKSVTKPDKKTTTKSSSSRSGTFSEKR